MNRPLTKSDALGMALALFLLALLTPMVFAQATQQKERAKRVVCGTNLKSISTSLMIYASQFNGEFPSLGAKSATTYDVTLKEEKGSKDASETRAAIFKDGKYPNNPMAIMWLIILDANTLNADAATKRFICPSDPFADTPAKFKVDDKVLTNFQDAKNISYSIPFPWVLDKDGTPVTGPQWHSNSGSNLPLVSDMAPYLGTKAKKGEAATQPDYGPNPDPLFTKDWAAKIANSQNHQFEGQNVAFNDNHVQWCNTPNVGEKDDSLWCIRKDPGDVPDDATEIPIEAGTLPHPPAGKKSTYDTVMIPTRDSKGNLK